MKVEEACAILGLSPTKYTENEVKKAFRRAALAHHPDKGGDHEQFLRAAQAADVLHRTTARAARYESVAFEQVLRAFQGGKACIDELCAIVNVRAFCRGIERLQVEGASFALECEAGHVMARCRRTNKVLECTTKISTSALRFFEWFGRLLQDSPDLRFTARQEGINLYCFERGIFDHFPCEDIALKY